MDLPDNSFKTRRSAPKEDEKPEKIEPIVQGRVLRKKKSIFSRMSSVFTAEDARDVAESIIWQSLVPALRDVIVDSFIQGVVRVTRGDATRHSPSRYGYRSGTPGRHDYGQYSRPSSQVRTSGNRRPSRSDYREIMLDNRADAEMVLDELENRIKRFNSVSLAELYELLDIEDDDHTNHEWGWFSSRGFNVVFGRDGYRLDLPRPEDIRI